MQFLTTALRTTTEILAAGIAITAASLLLYALSFNLRDRVARSFALIMVCVAVVFAGVVLSSAASSADFASFWLRFLWVGLVFLPPAYLHHSDALLETTGRPSRGRRRLQVRLTYLVSVGFLLTIPTGWLVGDLVTDRQGVVYLSRAALTWYFAGYYVIAIGWAWVNFWRAYRRTVTPTGRRRMAYLLAGAAGPALGSLPYLIFSTAYAPSGTVLFWIAALVANMVIWWFLILMAYSVAFFGVSWPDRVVRRRLVKWLLRGPITALVVLGVTTYVSRTGEIIGMADSVLVPLSMVITILLLEHAISLASPYWDRIVNWREGADFRLFKRLEERMLTAEDLRQFLESVLAAACDQFQVSTGFIAAFGEQGVDLFIRQGDNKDVFSEDNFLQLMSSSNGQKNDLFSWGKFWVLPLHDRAESRLLGLMGVFKTVDGELLDEQRDAFLTLGNRAAIALEDRALQESLYSSIENLTSDADLVSRLRAVSRYDRGGILTAVEDLPRSVEMSRFVKDALSHYWGGPKLTKNPLIQFQVVQQLMEQHDDNPANAMRSILRQAIESIRPDGERRFTAEWILYNILELKFLQGRKVRDVAMRLAMSEADLYRKQRVAIEAVAEAIAAMEREARTTNGA